MTDEQPSSQDREGPDDAQEQLSKTADGWRTVLSDTDLKDSADEVANGADRAARQPDYGREGS